MPHRLLTRGSVNMDSIEVGCAIIRRGAKILIAQRKPGIHLGGYWEFPGGKCRNGESMEVCLEREVYEELGVRILPRKCLGRTKHTFPLKEVSLHFYLCDWIVGVPVRHDCLDFRWITPGELRKYRFPPGDDAVIRELILRETVYFGSGSGFLR